MLKKIISNITNKKEDKMEINFFDLPEYEQKRIIKKAAFYISMTSAKNLKI